MATHQGFTTGMEKCHVSDNMDTSKQITVIRTGNTNNGLPTAEVLPTSTGSSTGLSTTHTLGIASRHLDMTSPTPSCSAVAVDNTSHWVSLAISQLQANPEALLSVEKNPFLLQKLAEDLAKGGIDSSTGTSSLESFQNGDPKLSDGAVIDVCVEEKSSSSYPEAETGNSPQPLINPGQINAVVKYLAAEMQAGHSSADFNYQVPETVGKSVTSVSSLNNYGEGQSIELVQGDIQHVQTADAVLYSASNNQTLEQTLAETLTTYSAPVSKKLVSSFASTTCTPTVTTYPLVQYSTDRTASIIAIVPEPAVAHSSETMGPQSGLETALPSSLVYPALPQSSRLPEKELPYNTSGSNDEIEPSHVVSVNLTEQALVQPLDLTPTQLLTPTDPNQLVAYSLQQPLAQPVELTTENLSTQEMAPATTGLTHDSNQAAVLTAYSTMHPVTVSQMSAAPMQSIAGDQERSVVQLLVGAPSADHQAGTDSTSDLAEHVQCEVIHIVPERDLVEMSEVYCVECNESYTTNCPMHDTSYFHISDKPILSRARSTLPNVMYFRKANNDTRPPHQCAILGVFAKEEIAAKTVFGPLVGHVSSTSEITPLATDIPSKQDQWTIFQNDQPIMVVDTENEDASNWLKFLRRADTSQSQNLVLYQCYLSLYFVTTRPIIQEEELCYWYSKDYATKLNIAQIPEGVGKCDECRSQFPSDAALKRHKKHEHPKDSMAQRKFICPQCQKGFTSRTKVELHMSKHTGARPIKCPVCTKGFTDKSNMKKHMKIHEDQKEHVCTVCGKGFRQRIHLETHQVIHSNKKTLSCTYCNRKFARTADLKQHENVHTKTQEFPCPICQRMFYRKNNMVKHMQIHNPKRERYPCSKCSKDFPNNYHMKRHLKICKGKKKTPMMKIRSETGAELGLSIAKKRIRQRDLMLQRQNSAVSHSSAVG